MDSLRNLLESTQLADAAWSIQVRSNTGETLLSHNESQLLSTASVAKIFLLIEAAVMIDERTLSPDELVQRQRVSRVMDSGIWQHMRTEELPIYDVCCLVASNSDNWATNVLLDRVGLNRVKDCAENVTQFGSSLLDFVRDERATHHPKSLSIGCAADWVFVIDAIAQQTLINSNVSKQLETWLSLNSDLSLVMQPFNLDPLAHQSRDTSLRIFNKTGTDAGVRVDVGYIQSARGGVSYAVVCNWSDESSMQKKNAVYDVMRGIGVEIRNYLL